MSNGTPAGKAPCADSGKLMGGRNVVTIVTGSMGITGDAQQAHVQRTQNAGQPLSGLDSFVPSPQVSGTTSELTPLASPINRARSMMKNARRIRSMVYHAHLGRPLPLGSPVELRNDMGVELELAVLLACAVIGQSTFARFEIETRGIRKIVKWLMMAGLTLVLYRFVGHWALLVPMVLGVAGTTFHLIWCRRNGIDPLHATPARKYYELRSWRWPDAAE